MTLTAWLFKLARLSADGRAVRKGPQAVVKRVARKAVFRRTGGTINKWMK